MSVPSSAGAAAAPFAGARWLDVVPRSECLPDLDARVLLHAGPPLRGAAPIPMRQAAIQAILFEDLAPDAAVAQALLASGTVKLEPAQDHGVVTPLAQVVSHSMPMAVVGDSRYQGFAPLSEGPAPALRFGAADPGCLARLRETSHAAGALAQAVRLAPIDLGMVIKQALELGDECHSRTAEANRLLLAQLPTLPDTVRARISANAGFVLPILMGAAAWSLEVLGGRVVAAGGNGVEFGVRLRGDTAWRNVAAEPPRGTSFPGPAAVTLGAIGDSAVLDFCGLGGQAIRFAPALAEEWQSLLPGGIVDRFSAILDEKTGAVSPEQVSRTGQAPVIHLAMLDRSGHRGLIGRGFYIPPVDLFTY